MNVHNAFLHGDLTEDVYMKIPPGFEIGRDVQVCRLRQSLYGLKQVPRCWFAKFADALRRYGFIHSYSDYLLFTYYKQAPRIILLVYVDDLIIAGNNHRATVEFKMYLSTCFHMKDLGKLKYFLGVEVARNFEGIYFCEQKYELDIIVETCLLGSKPVTFPMEENQKLGISQSPDMADGAKYRRLVGRLLYLAFTRPYIGFGVHILSQFLQKYKEEH
ncbi:transmembrane signal receptor [Lithospermum erythrorhizon]|uniref:Transmembrane signal receptor n=1 Tax=Lithospermum erythrorhizon TaxID=34254 RepID=A0AAV3QB18_LITER